MDVTLWSIRSLLILLGICFVLWIFGRLDRISIVIPTGRCRLHDVWMMGKRRRVNFHNESFGGNCFDLDRSRSRRET
jgi:hypothetical protein